VKRRKIPRGVHCPKRPESFLPRVAVANAVHELRVSGRQKVRGRKAAARARREAAS
jgi:hypothetical protein